MQKLSLTSQKGPVLVMGVQVSDEMLGRLLTTSSVVAGVARKLSATIYGSGSSRSVPVMVC